MSALHLAVGVPTGGAIDGRTVKAILALLGHLGALGIGASFDISRAPNVAMARNELAFDAMAKTPATHLLMVDNDLDFAPETIVQMLETGHDCVSVAYRHKDTDPNGVISFLVNLDLNQEPIAGCVKLVANGAGLLLVSRELIERLYETHAHLRYRWPAPGAEGGWREAIGIFDEWVDADRTRVTEDVAFYRRVREAGFDTWLMLDAPTVHYGRSVRGWGGNYIEVWQACHAVAKAQRPEPRRYAPFAPPGEPIQANALAPLPARNAPCPCGSGRKWKRCHGAEEAA